MFSRPSWMSSQAPASAPVPGSTPLTSVSRYTAPRQRDPNVPDYRLQIGSKCIYERELPGGSYITAHTHRLQCGYYDSPVIHEDCISNVRFIAISFVFHEASTDRRFKSARIKLSIHDESRTRASVVPIPPQLNYPVNNDQSVQTQRSKPKFLRYAPHLLYGAMSPETLDWNFNLAGSLGVSQTPVSASLNPSGGIKTSYKIYQMMKIQGSLRTNNGWAGKNYDVEDGELVWTLEENYLQKSGLPREFTFVVLLTKGDPRNDVKFEIDIEPNVAAWFGEFPQWWIHLLKYQPLYKDPLDLDKEIGQKFEPSDGEMGYNFAQLNTVFDDFVSLPGTTYSTRDWGSATGSNATSGAAKKEGKQSTQQSKTHAAGSEAAAGQESSQNTLHLRIHLEPPAKNSYSISSYPYPEPVTTSQRSAPSGLPALAPPSQLSAQHRSTPDSQTKPGKLARRVTVGGSTASTTPRPKSVPKSQLATQYEEREKQTPSDPKTSSHSEDDEECEFSFPESITPAKSPSLGQSQINPRHRPAKSTSTTSSSIFEPPFPDQTLTTGHSLRRTHSRSGLRSASLSSQPPSQPQPDPDPESETAISAAMDMLAGSPPPPSASPVPAAPDPPPVFGPAPTLITTRRLGVGPVIKPREHASIIDTGLHRPDMSLATPRTRAALADRIEIEKAERERFERRNGHKDNHAITNLSTQKMPQTPIEERNRKVRAGTASRQLSGTRHIDNTIDVNEEEVSDQPSAGVGSNARIGKDDSFVMADSKEREREREKEKIRQKRYSLPVTSMGIGYPSSRSTSVAGGVSKDARPDGLKYDNNDPTGPTSIGMNTNGPSASSGKSAESDARIGLGVNDNPIGNGRSSLMIPIGGVARNKRDVGPSNAGIRNHAAETGILGTGYVNFDAQAAGSGGMGGGGGFRRDGNSSVYPGYEYIE